MEQKQGYDPRAIANLFLQWAKADDKHSSYTPLKIIKLVYIAHGWCLAILGKPLIFDQVEAWKFGPVIPRLYHAFKRFGRGVITELAKMPEVEGLVEYDKDESTSGQVHAQIEDEDIKMLSAVYHDYGGFDALELANMTHLSDSPWDKARKDSMSTIPNDIIKSEYERLWKQIKSGNTQRTNQA